MTSNSLKSIDIFTDPVRENHDIITKLLTPFESKVRETILKLKMPFRLNENQIYDIVHYPDISRHSLHYILEPILSFEDINKDSVYYQTFTNLLMKYLKRTIGGGQMKFDTLNKKILNDSYIEFDLARDDLINLSDEELIEFTRSNCVSWMRTMLPYKIRPLKPVADIFDVVKLTKESLNNIFEEATKMVRSDTLMFKIAEWIVDLIVNKNLSAKVNLLKVRVMSHDDRPIYSIIEEV